MTTSRPTLALPLLIAGMVVVAALIAVGVARLRPAMTDDARTAGASVTPLPALAAPAPPAGPLPDPPPVAGAASAHAPPALAQLLDRTSSERLTPDLAARLPRLTDAQHPAAVVAMVMDRSDGDTVRHEGINLLRRSGHPHLDRDLIAILDRPDERERFRAFATQHLGVSLGLAQDGDGEASAVVRDRLRAALDDRHAGVRREALQGLLRAGDPEAAAQVRRGLADPRWADARDLVIHCAHDLGLRELIPAIRAQVAAEDEVVRIAAINVLGQWRDEASRPAFELAVASPSLRLQRAGALALASLSEPR